MASRIGRVLQDQNLNVHLHDASSGLKTNVTKAPKKGSFGGRKPLGDLSNSLKSSVNQASKKQNFATTKKKDSSKVQSGERKALSDISNSGIPNNVCALPKKKQNAKLNVKAEERLNLSTIAEEQFLHDHQQCIKAQRGCVDLDQFLQILGLDNDVSKEHAQAHAMSAKDEIENSLVHLELEEMIETSYDFCISLDSIPVSVSEAKDEIENSLVHLELEEMIETSYDFCISLDSIPACTSPVSPKTFRWNDEECCNFKLIESPKN